MERRRFVASVACALTGCLAYDSDEEEDDAPPGYAGRLPPSATAGFDHHDVGAIRRHESLEADDYAAPRSFVGLTGFSAEGLGNTVSFGERRATAVAEGGFEPDAVYEGLESKGFTEAERDGFGTDDGGYPVLENGGVAVGIRGRWCIRSALGADAVAGAADALEGWAESADDDTDFGRLPDELGYGTFTTGRVVNDPRSPEVGRGKRVDVEAGDDEAYVTVVRVYGSADGAASAANAVNTTAAESLRRPSAETEGRVVRVKAKASVDRL